MTSGKVTFKSAFAKQWHEIRRCDKRTVPLLGIGERRLTISINSLADHKQCRSATDGPAGNDASTRTGTACRTPAMTTRQVTFTTAFAKQWHEIRRCDKRTVPLLEIGERRLIISINSLADRKQCRSATDGRPATTHPREPTLLVERRQ